MRLYLFHSTGRRFYRNALIRLISYHRRGLHACEHVVLGLLPVLFRPPLQAPVLEPKRMRPLADGIPGYTLPFAPLLAGRILMVTQKPAHLLGRQPYALR